MGLELVYFTRIHADTFKWLAYSHIRKKGIMLMRYFIGIDVAKFKHTTCVIDQDGAVCVEPFDFANDALGFNKLWDAIKPYTSCDHRVGLEDTGHYADNLRSFLFDMKCTVAMINPATSTHLRKAENCAKNDRLDCIVIAGALMNPKYYRIVTKDTTNYPLIRQYTRLHHTRKEELCRYKAMLQKDIDKVFPEYNSVFPTLYSKTYMTVLEEFQSADTIAHTDIRRLRTALKPKGKGNHVSISAEDLKDAARKSIGHSDPAIEMDIVCLVQLINKISSIIAELDKKTEEFSLSLNSPILAISGISHFSAMSIISELGDITRFSDEKAVIKYAGLNPYVYDSGTYSMPHTRIEKKGSKYLRKTLYQIIDPVIQNNPVFLAYYKKKISQGKSYRCAQGHCIRKLLRIIYHILSTGQQFDPAKLR